jgi:hypothetical protein|tara:strand:- start:345 stop:659 length:315 start_codon:yes stop_codon:yes gene_type:complete
MGYAAQRQLAGEAEEIIEMKLSTLGESKTIGWMELKQKLDNGDEFKLVMVFDEMRSTRNTSRDRSTFRFRSTLGPTLIAWRMMTKSSSIAPVADATPASGRTWR